MLFELRGGCLLTFGDLLFLGTSTAQAEQPSMDLILPVADFAFCL